MGFSSQLQTFPKHYLICLQSVLAEEVDRHFRGGTGEDAWPLQAHALSQYLTININDTAARSLLTDDPQFLETSVTENSEDLLNPQD